MFCSESMHRPDDSACFIVSGEFYCGDGGEKKAFRASSPTAEADSTANLSGSGFGVPFASNVVFTSAYVCCFSKHEAQACQGNTKTSSGMPVPSAPVANGWLR